MELKSDFTYDKQILRVREGHNITISDENFVKRLTKNYTSDII